MTDWHSVEIDGQQHIKKGKPQKVKTVWLGANVWTWTIRCPSPWKIAREDGKLQLLWSTPLLDLLVAHWPVSCHLDSKSGKHVYRSRYQHHTWMAKLSELLPKDAFAKLVQKKFSTRWHECQSACCCWIRTLSLLSPAYFFVCSMTWNVSQC